MTKLGKPFELVVADVVKEIDPGSTVHAGKWVAGPDGRRELDVHIEGMIGGERRRVLIECKDFNRDTTGPVGIGYVDALDSKRKDLGMDVSFICSNAGFTADAIRKAKRVGIGLIAVLREGDERIRYEAMEEVYIRRVRVESLESRLHGNVASPIPFEEIAYQGIPIGNWVLRRAMLIIGYNSIVSGTYTLTYKFRQPLEFTLPSGSILATGLDFRLRLSGGWFVQQTALDATSGFYDWLRRRFLRAPIAGKIRFKCINPYGGVPIDFPLDEELSSEVREGEYCIKLVMVEGLETREPIPEIDSFIVEDDLELAIKTQSLE